MIKTIKFLLIFSLITTISFGQTKEKVEWTKMGNNKSATFKEVQDNFNQYWKDRTPQKGQGYKIFKRWENQANDRVYPSGNLELLSSNYANFMQWENYYGSKQNKNLSKTQLSLKATASAWTTLNGTAIPSGYDSGSGRLSFITFHPSNSQTIFVGSPDGGLWKTTNGGTSWTTNTDFLTVIGCAGLVIDPNTPTTMYLATGDRESDRRSIGVLKSTDGGASWGTTGLVWTAADNYKITKIVMDPSNPLIMMITTDGGIFKTTDGWANFLHKSPNYNFFYDIKFKPGDPNTMYAASFKEVFKSTDKGETWGSAISGIPNTLTSRIELAVTADDAAYVYALVGNSEGGLKGVYRSTDSGASFTDLMSQANAGSYINILHGDKDPTQAVAKGFYGGQASHDMAIAVSPTNKDLVTIGGINQWQSTDGGANWTRITYWLGVNNAYPGSEDDTTPYIHADIQDIVYGPDGTTLYSTCDGGISKGASHGQTTWIDITANIAVGQQTSMSLSAISANTYFTGLQDIGTLVTTSPGAWSVLGGGDGEDGLIDRTNDNVKIYSTVNGEFSRNKSGVISRYPSLESEWFTPIHQDPTDATLVYVGGREALYKSTDILTNANGTNPTWVKLGSPNPVPVQVPALSGNNILRFEIAPSDNQVIYAITGNGNDSDVVHKIYKSTDAGATWTDISAGLPFAAAAIKNLAISNTDPLKMWVVFSGYSGTSKVFKTTNGGTTWTDVFSNTLPNLPINTIVHVKSSANDGIYIGADIGVYYMDDTQTSWTAYSTDLPKNAVQDLEIFYTSTTAGKLRAATYGRGTWESDINFTTLGVGEIAIPASEVVTLYPNPVIDGYLNLKLKDSNTKYDYIIYNILGSQITKGKIENVDNKIPLNNAANGLYVIKLIQGNKISTQKFLIKN